MKHRGGGSLLVGVTVSFVAVMFLAPSAFAKGPSEGVITGPGLAHPIPLTGPEATASGSDLWSVVEQSGFLVGTFDGVRARGRLAHQPAGTLGPRYTITYTMSIPDSSSSEIVQYVFPYAEPRPITYLPAGQKFWGSNQTVGAWFAARVDFKQTLVRLGLPAKAPAPIPTPAVGATDAGPGPDLASNGSLAIPLSIVGVLVAGTLAVILLTRRRTRRSLPA